ncbi:MAG: methyltransferase [Thaumarchaeota archaeon]|nr:methyltransferase [Nitrososphaerota archaeon]
MPVIPNLLERFALLKFNQGPGLLLDILGAGAFRAVVLAIKRGIFEALTDSPLTSKELAYKIKSSEQDTAILLEFLESFSYVKQSNGKYSNTAMTSKWLLSKSPSNLADMVRIWDSDIFEFWDKYLEGAVVKGKASITIYEWFNKQPDGWRTFNFFEMAIARWLGNRIAASVRLGTAQKILDVGGGHGMYSIMFCRRYPSLSATVFDKPEPLETAKENVAAEKMNDRITLQPGDFWTDDLGSGYDGALLFNLIHNYLPDKNIELLGKVSKALNPGATVAIFDQLKDMATSPALKAIVRFFALTYWVTVGGHTYSLNDIADWLAKTGFTKPKRVRFVPGLIIATKRR